MFRSQAREKIEIQTTQLNMLCIMLHKKIYIYIKTPTYKMMLQLLHTTYKTKYVYMLNKKKKQTCEKLKNSKIN